MPEYDCRWFAIGDVNDPRRVGLLKRWFAPLYVNYSIERASGYVADAIVGTGQFNRKRDSRVLSKQSADCYGNSSSVRKYQKGKILKE